MEAVALHRVAFLEYFCHIKVVISNMADGHTDMSSASKVSDSSSNLHYEDNSSEFEQYLS